MVPLRIENAKWEYIGELEVQAGKVLLSQLEAANIEIPNACRAGMCAACMCHIVSGSEFIKKDTRWEPAFPLGDDEVMTCIGWVLDTDETIILRTMY